MDIMKLGESILLVLLSSILAPLSSSLSANPISFSNNSYTEYKLSDYQIPTSCPQDPFYIASDQLPKVCKDDSADVISFTTTESGIVDFVYILADSFDQIISILPINGFDFNDLDAGQYHIYGVAYQGNLILHTGAQVTSMQSTICLSLSANMVAVDVMKLNLDIDILSDFHGYPISQSGASDGQISATAQGGTGSYSFSWDTEPPQTGSTATGLTVGTYTVMVSDEGGCSAQRSVALNEPLLLEASLSSSLTFGSFDLRCADSKDGELQATVTGGVLPYTYSWVGFSTNDSFVVDLLPGLYELTVSDANGAEVVLSYELKAPPGLQLEVETRAPSCPDSEDGSLSLNTTGGISPYSYRWATGQHTSSLVGLKADSYTVEVSDRFGCSQQLDILLDEPDSLDISFVAESPSCAGIQDGWIALDVSGGTLPYRFIWAQGAKEASLFDLNGGIYEVQVLDGNNCATQLAIELTEPSPLIIVPTITPDNGTGNGSIELQVNEEASIQSYIWSHGDSLAIAQGLKVGTYSVTILEESGCETNQSFQVPAADKLDCLEVHTGFTPNGDGVNETWHIPCIDWFPESEVTIYNRWGQVLFQATAYQNDWGGLVNGRPIPDGTYFYTLQLNSETDKRLLKGTVSILR